MILFWHTVLYCVCFGYVWCNICCLELRPTFHPSQGYVSSTGLLIAPSTLPLRLSASAVQGSVPCSSRAIPLYRLRFKIRDLTLYHTTNTPHSSSLGQQINLFTPYFSPFAFLFSWHLQSSTFTPLLKASTHINYHDYGKTLCQIPPLSMLQRHLNLITVLHPMSLFPLATRCCHASVKNFHCVKNVS